MSRVVITTKKCPCCQYQYQETEYYKIVEEIVDKQVPRIKNGKPIEIDEWDSYAIAMDPYGKIAQKKMKWVKVPKQVEKFDRKEITKGEEDFSPVTVVTELSEVTTIGMECPNCGVYMNFGKCTTKEEKDI